MARPLRIEYPGAIYHITSRGNARERIFLEDADRRIFLDIFGSVVEKYNWLCHAYCLLDNHYHLLIETPDPNLSLGMRQLNGVYTQSFNRRHSRVGHVFQGRYKSILVQKDEHLLELCRYIVLNPVRAGMVNQPKEWGWSSYKETGYACKVSKFLTVDWVQGQFANQKNAARKGYRKFVAAGVEVMDESPWKKLVGQVILGDTDFISDIQSRICEAKEIGELSRAQRFAGRPSLKKIFPPDILRDKPLRNEQIKIAHIRYGYTLKAIAEHLKIHYTTVSKIVKK